MEGVEGCHLVGSIPMGAVDTVFRECFKRLPGRLATISDGELGDRSYFVGFQRKYLPAAILAEFSDNTELQRCKLTDLELEQGRRDMAAWEGETGYDVAAFKGYLKFLQARSKGIVPGNAKFMVGLPTLANVVGLFVKPEFQADMEALYEQALFKALKNIQDHIPHEDLAVQIDMGMDMSYWENLCFKPWFTESTYVADYVSRMIDQVDTDVDLGLHFCYGDMNHQHWAEPKSTRGVVDLFRAIAKRASRSIQWIHLPVPKSADQHLNDYLSPLQDAGPTLEAWDTKLYLGLIHADEQCRKRIETAKLYVDRFGVSSECGFGRSSSDEMERIMAAMASVSQPNQHQHVHLPKHQHRPQLHPTPTLPASFTASTPAQAAS